MLAQRGGDKGKESCVLVAVRNVKLELNVTPLRWDRGEDVNVAVEVSEGSRMADGPVHPGENFPTCGTPDIPKSGGQLQIHLQVRVSR